MTRRAVTIVDGAPFIEFAYLTGWRRGEIRSLTWRQVDFAAGVIRLEPGTTKNDEGRTFPFACYQRLRALLQAQWARAREIQQQTGEITPWVFYRGGRQVGDFRFAWLTACSKAGLQGRLVHDLRRTAVRNLERAGVPRSWAMKLTGHKTENVYRRYAIVSEADLAEAVNRLAALHEHAASDSRRVVPISEAVSERRGTIGAQSGFDAGDELDQLPAQTIETSGWKVRELNPAMMRPQRDSNPRRRRERAVS